jgi:hypothetical protein
MNKSRVAFSPWWLALSLAVKFALGAGLVLLLIGGPEHSAALVPAPAAPSVEADHAVQLAQSRRRLRQRERARRAAREKERAAAEARERAAQEEKERAEKERAEAEAREKARAEEQARKEAEAREKAAREERERAEAEQRARQRKSAMRGKQGERSAGSAAGRDSRPLQSDAGGNPLPPPNAKAGTAEAGGRPDGSAEAAKGKEASNRSPLADDQPPAPAEAEPEAWTDAEIIDALRECMRLLAPIAAHIDVSPPIRTGQCGAPAPVVVRRVGASMPVEISPPAVLNCRMVAKLHEWTEGTLQPAARELLKSPVRRMVNASGYVCRNRYGASIDKISEHAFANALDISAFVTTDGRNVDVLSNWGKTERDLRAMAIARAEAERAKAEAERQAKAEAAEKAAGKAKGKDAAGSANDAGKASGADKAEEPDKSQHPAARRPLEKRGAAGEKQRSAKGSADARPEPVPLPRQKDAGGSRPLASAERSQLGRGAPAVADVPPVEAPPITTEGHFLRRLHKGACGVFGTVLGPEANEAHRNHFHLDLAARRRHAFCE